MLLEFTKHSEVIYLSWRRSFSELKRKNIDWEGDLKII